MFRSTKSRFAVVLGSVIATGAAVLLAIGCATNPVTGKRQFSLVSPEQELQMGEQGNEAVMQEYGVYDDPRLAAYVDSVGQALGRVSHLPNLKWHFTIVDDDAVNAFALPGGYIYITRGILSHLDSEAQLAGVMGHECGHVTARHTAQQETQQQLAGIGLGVASVFSQTFQRYSSLAQQGLQLMFLKYSRDDETQADQLGVDYSTKAGWDSREMPKTYQMLGRVEAQSGQQLPTFLATHPDPGNRFQKVTAEAQAATAGKTGLVIRRDSYLSHVNGIIYGVNAANGYFEGSQFYHPGLGIQMTFPSGWQTANQHSAVLAQQPQQRAVMQLTMANTSGAAPDAYVQSLQSAGKIAGAQGATERVGAWPAWIGRITVQNQDGSQGSMVAGFVQRSADQTFQVLGQTQAVGDADEAAILASIRSLHPIDQGRLNPKPARVAVVAAPAAGTFGQVLARLGPLGVSNDEETVINNLDLDAQVNRGQTLKVVRPGSK